MQGPIIRWEVAGKVNEREELLSPTKVVSHVMVLVCCAAK